MIRLYTLFSLLVIVFNSSGQNEFYNKGGLVFLNSGSGSSTPTLTVNGNLINQDGTFNNSGSFLELKGNITNTQTTTYHYVSTGIERFSGSSDQTIYGKWNGTSANQDQFYNLKINKGSISGENIILDNTVEGNTVNINASGSLSFEGSNGIIRTQSTSSGTNDINATGDYTNKLFLQNSDPNKFTGYSTGSGATTKYIEGKLQLQLSAGNNYYFPVGVKPTLLGGMNAININVNSISASTAVVGYVKPYSTALVTSSYTFCDVAQVDNNTGTANYFSTCIGGPDGIMDLMQLTNHTDQSWEVTPQSTPASVNYDITFYPSTNFNASATFTSIPCGSFGNVKYLARNGVPGGNLAILGNSPAFNRIQGYYSCITGNSLSSQNGFSNFQLWGADNSNTNLPVELTKFFITPVNNEYFNLNWETASELNNAGFYLQRSSNSSPFENIGWIAGNGTTTSVHNYSFADYNVTPGTTYYYRLMQLDNNQTFKYSNVLSGILKSNDFNVYNIIPNPTTINPLALIFTPEDGVLEISIFDILGNNLKSNRLSLLKGNNNIDIDLSSLAAATYVIKFNFNNTIITKKIIKN